MKAVLLSIRPEWCSRIFSGCKTVEIRKTRPVSLKEPFKCYIYCTKGTKFFCWKAVDHLYFDDRPHKIFDRRVDGMVVGEFICDDIRRINRHYENNHLTDKGFDHLKLQIKQHICAVYGISPELIDVSVIKIDHSGYQFVIKRMVPTLNIDVDIKEEK